MQDRLRVIEDEGDLCFAPRPPQGAKQARILVVEDDHLQQSLLKSALEAGGYEVETASDGLSAVWKIREGQYDLVLLDYQLPEMDGLATARLVNDLMGEAARPRLVALTAMPDIVIGRELLAGKAFDGVVAKSADLPELLATVTHYLRSAPASAARRASESNLLLQDWAAYETAPGRPETRHGRTAPTRILVVEDDEMQGSLLKAALQAEGYDVETAPDGLSAVRKMRESGFDLALIDYDLPEMDGLAAAKLIGDLMGESTRPRLVALTASPDRLSSRAARSHRVFEQVVSKLEGLPAVLAIVKRNL